MHWAKANVTGVKRHNVRQSTSANQTDTWPFISLEGFTFKNKSRTDQNMFSKLGHKRLFSPGLTAWSKKFCKSLRGKSGSGFGTCRKSDFVRKHPWHISEARHHTWRLSHSSAQDLRNMLTDTYNLYTAAAVYIDQSNILVFKYFGILGHGFHIIC